MSRLADGVEALRSIRRAWSARGAFQRARHELRKKRGSFVVESRISLPADRGSPRFTIDLDRLGAAIPEDGVVRARRVRDGSYQAYGDAWHRIPSGNEWQTHPISGVAYPDEAWYEVRHVDATVGDIKDTWEPGRFGWVYDLIRGYAATRDASFAAAFWRHTEDFLRSNKPFYGVQWSCGQETSIRAVAWLWAEAAFTDVASPQQREMLERALVTSGERIADAIGYGLSQRNNHGLWESAGLAALGARFISKLPVATDWVDRGLAGFEKEANDQFAIDGWYIQHSVTYTRVALQTAVVAQLASRVVDRSLSTETIVRIRAAGRLLAMLHDSESGDAPNYGANDGANSLPLSSAGYRDFRPILTAVSSLFDFAVPAPFHPDRTTEAWLGLAATTGDSRPAMATGDSGWVVARRSRTFVFARAGQYHSRPGHLDPLHVDVWFDGKPVAIDAGTYRYTGPPPWNDGLRATAVHNTVDVPSIPIAKRGPGFLWLGVPSATVVSAVGGATSIRIVLHNESWARHDLTHIREIEVRDDAVLVTDRMEGNPGTLATLHWLTAPGGPIPHVESNEPLEMRPASRDESSVAGWRSLHYGSRSEATSTTYSFVIPAAGRVELRSTFIVAAEPFSTTG